METVDLETESPKAACQPEERPSSPVNDCAICLEQLTDKSFTNSCLHMFCFHCLKAWSKVKPECPLCKQDFCSIIHNIRSMDDYDEYHVPPASRFAAPDSTSFFAQTLARDALGLPFRDILRQRDFFSASRRFFSYRTTFIPGPFNVPRERTASSLVIQPYVDNLQIQNNYPSSISSSSTSSSSSSSSSSTSHAPNLSNRKDVYLKELEIRPLSDGRHRISSPEFYRENEGQVHRLGRWVNRELAAISQLGLQFNPIDVLALIMDMLPNYDIQSTTFHSSLFPHLGIHTRRFIKEFYHFAISPYDMEEYDRLSVYMRQRTGSSVAFIVTVGSDESEDVQVIPTPTVSQSQSTVRPWINLTQVPSSTYSSSILQNGPRLTSSTSTTWPPVPSTTSRPTTTSQQIINISDSENDDCIIIDEVKTAPQTIVLDDSDEENPPAPKSPVPSTSGYRPPTRTETTETTPVLPSTSTYVPETRNAKSLPKNTARKRSPSCSSVISTDNSIIDQEPVPIPEPKEKKRKSQSKPKKTHKRHELIDYYLSSSEFSEPDDSNDSDWEQTPKKKKKPTKKHSEKSEKKTRKRRKTERSKSPKRKKCVDPETNTRKSSKHASKSHKSKKSSKSSLESNSNSCTPSTKNESVSNSSKNTNVGSKSETNYSPIRPKLRSVVKKVDRSESTDDNLPSASYNYVFSNGESQYKSYVRRSFYSSDSD